MEIREVLKKINQAGNLYIYGAGIVASGVSAELLWLQGAKTKAFVVTEKNNNPDALLGLPVLSVEAFSGVFQDGDLLLIAVPEEYQGAISETLEKRKITSVIKLDSHLQSELTGKYISEKYGMTYIPSPDASKPRQENAVKDAAVYMAVSHLDKPLIRNYSDPPFVKKIQVGAHFTDQRIAAVTDDDTAISDQNPLYGELTATWWIWKNDRHFVKGLYHYRRTLDIGEKDLQRLSDGEYDVLLPVPFICRPDASAQYGRYVHPDDFQIMADVLKEKFPEDYSFAMENLKGELLYNYNILIARAETFGAYAEWLFDILSEVTRRCENEKRNRLPRYIGRLGEILTSIYFLSDQRNFKIANTGLIWRV